MLHSLAWNMIGIYPWISPWCNSLQILSSKGCWQPARRTVTHYTSHHQDKPQAPPWTGKIIHLHSTVFDNWKVRNTNTEIIVTEDGSVLACIFKANLQRSQRSQREQQDWMNLGRNHQRWGTYLKIFRLSINAQHIQNICKWMYWPATLEPMKLHNTYTLRNIQDWDTG